MLKFPVPAIKVGSLICSAFVHAQRLVCDWGGLVGANVTTSGSRSLLQLTLQNGSTAVSGAVCNEELLKLVQ